jgi:hypothetical protein
VSDNGTDPTDGDRSYEWCLRQAALDDLINGVPRDQYGMHCQHGNHIMVANPDVPGDYPGTVMADPWPCDEGCTPEGVAARIEAEVDAYEAGRWADYWASL